MALPARFVLACHCFKTVVRAVALGIARRQGLPNLEHEDGMIDHWVDTAQKFGILLQEQLEKSADAHGKNLLVYPH